MPQIHNLERLKQERHNIEVNNLEMYKQEDLKEQCHEILIFFLLKRFNLGPIRTDKNGFANLFVLRRPQEFDRKVRKLCVREVIDYADMKLFL